MSPLMPQLRQKARVVRRVTIGDDLSVVVDDSVSGDFRCLLLEAARTVNVLDGTPRLLPAATLWHGLAPYMVPGGELHPADRVEDGHGQVWELVSHSRPLRAGAAIRGYSANVLPVVALYPFSGRLESNEGDELAPEVPFAMWGMTEVHGDRGAVDNGEAEAPVEFLPLLEEANTRMIVGDKIFHVVECAADYNGPRAKLLLRKISG